MTIVTCKRIGRDLINWLDDAPDQDREELCEALDCSCDLGVTGGETESLAVSVDADNEITGDVKISDDDGNQVEVRSDGVFVGPELPPSTEADEDKVLVVDEDGNPKWGEPQESGEICASIEGMTEGAWGANPFIPVFDEASGECRKVRVNPEGILTDIRADVTATARNGIVPFTTTIRFMVKNVSNVTPTTIDLTATFPAELVGDIGSVTTGISAGSSGSVGSEQGSGNTRLFEVSNLGPGESAWAEYPVSIGNSDVYSFAADVDVTDPGVIDASTADDHATVSVNAKDQEAPPTTECPPMNVQVEGNPIALLEARPDGGFLNLPENDFSQLVIIGRDETFEFTSDVPVTVEVRIGPSNSGNGDDKLGKIVDGVAFAGNSTAGGGIGIGSTAINQNPQGDVVTDLGQAVHFEVARNSAQGADRTLYGWIAIRPNQNCRWQGFPFMILSEPKTGKTLTLIDGATPPHTETDLLRPNDFEGEAFLGQMIIATNREVATGDSRPTPVWTLSIPQGQSFDFTIESTGWELPSLPTSGVIDIEVLSDTQWRVKIADNGSPANDADYGPLKFRWDP